MKNLIGEGRGLWSITALFTVTDNFTLIIEKELAAILPRHDFFSLMCLLLSLAERRG